MDDVSLRGARGVLISITGGKDLTLYEVDEAATRIREEVDADANIIVGATFDESLDGIIRVSVVATGVAIDAANKAVSLHAPAPLAHQLKADHVRIADEMPEARALRSAPVAAETKVFLPPPPAQRATHALRLPSIEDFPFPGQNEFRARRGELAEEDHPETRSLLQRLAAVSLRRREDEQEQEQQQTPKARPPTKRQLVQRDLWDRRYAGQ
jgi:cell division protein FtsZ